MGRGQRFRAQGSAEPYRTKGQCTPRAVLMAATPGLQAVERGAPPAPSIVTAGSLWCSTGHQTDSSRCSHPAPGTQHPLTPAHRPGPFPEDIPNLSPSHHQDVKTRCGQAELPVDTAKHRWAGGPVCPWHRVHKAVEEIGRPWGALSIGEAGTHVPALAVAVAACPRGRREPRAVRGVSSSSSSNETHHQQLKP